MCALPQAVPRTHLYRDVMPPVGGHHTQKTIRLSNCADTRLRQNCKFTPIGRRTPPWRQPNLLAPELCKRELAQPFVPPSRCYRDRRSLLLLLLRGASC